MHEFVSSSVLLQAGRSPELTAAMQAIGEATADGEPRFPPAACRQLARLIACRSYAPALLELCHLVVVAEAAGEGYEAAFWRPGPVRADGFRAAAADAAAAPRRFPRISAEPHAARIAYADGLFSVSLPRAPLLAALMEFLVSTIGYEVVDDALAPLLAAPCAEAAGAAANTLSRALYDHLREHLPAAQVQRKFQMLTDFLNRRRGELDDDAVLDFWRQASADQAGGDFRTYASVYRACINLWHAFEVARDRRALEATMSIEQAGDIADQILSGETGCPLAELTRPPASAVKFLNKRETEALTMLIESDAAAVALPLSLLRCEVFGRQQNRLTQARRRQLSQQALRDGIDAGPDESYADRRAVLARLAAHLERVLRAAYHVLARARRTGTESEECARAFRGISRQGFAEEDSRDPTVGAGFAAAVDPLLEIRERLRRYAARLDSLDPPAGDWPRQFDADSAVFRAQFHLLYGDTA